MYRWWFPFTCFIVVVVGAAAAAAAAIASSSSLASMFSMLLEIGRNVRADRGVVGIRA